MSTHKELLDRWMGRLGSLRSTRVRADLLSEVNAAILDLENEAFIPWFLNRTGTLSIAQNDLFVTLPGDFLIEQEKHRPYYVLEGKTYYLKKVTSGAIYGVETSNTRPTFYSINGSEFHFRPVADQAYTIYFPYYQKSGDPMTDDEDNVTNKWLLNAPEWIGMRALKMTAGTHLQNEKKGSVFAGLEREQKQKIYKRHIAREAQNQEYEVGGISDGT